MVFTRVKLLHNNLLKKLKHRNIFKVYHLYILDMFTWAFARNFKKLKPQAEPPLYSFKKAVSW